MILLVGKRDFPADGVQDYCEYLRQAMELRGIDVDIVRVDWSSKGGLRALRTLWVRSRDWAGEWVVLQYTALAWSTRGFPFGALAAFEVLRWRRARCAVVFHEPFAVCGDRVIDCIRGACQDWLIRKLHKRGERSVFPVPLGTVSWLSSDDSKAVYISIGANLPDDVQPREHPADYDRLEKSIAIYCLSDPPNLYRELADISAAASMSVANGTKLRIIFLGRGTAEADEEIKKAFNGTPAEISNLGILDSNTIRRTLAGADVMLCVRGPLYPRRGSALAGIACGLPVIGYAGAAEGTPIMEAGVELVPYGDRTALGTVLRRILLDPNLWQQLHEKSLEAHRRYFSWALIAEKFDQALFSGESGSPDVTKVRTAG
jgi:glycosyltransferase involved in cell wall biosynthesis